jgi:cell division transport system permease protein
VFLRTELTRDNAINVETRLAMLPDAKRVHLIPREQAWKDLTAQDPTLTVAMPDDPLPDAFHIEVADARNVERMALRLRDVGMFPEIERVTDAGSEVRIMLAFARLVKVIGGSAAAGLFVATLFIVYNTIRLTVFARRREIRIMQLVGATSWFIRVPLLLEGLFHGIAGAGIASCIVLFFARQLAVFVNQIHSPLIGDVPSQATPLKMVASLVLIGAFVGLTGSYLSIRRYLRQV